LCVFDVVIIVFRGTFQMHFSEGDVLSKWQLPNVQFTKVTLGCNGRGEGELRLD